MGKEQVQLIEDLETAATDSKIKLADLVPLMTIKKLLELDVYTTPNKLDSRVRSKLYGSTTTTTAPASL